MIYHFLTFTFSDNNLITVVKNIVLCFHRKLIQERFLINSVSVYNWRLLTGTSESPQFLLTEYRLTKLRTKKQLNFSFVVKRVLLVTFFIVRCVHLCFQMPKKRRQLVDNEMENETFGAICKTSSRSWVLQLLLARRDGAKYLNRSTIT